MIDHAMKKINMKQQRPTTYILPFLLLAVDYLAILLAEAEAFGLHGLLEGRPYGYGRSYIFLWVPLLFLLFLGSFRAYNRMRPFLDAVRRVVYSVGYSLITCILLLYFTHTSAEVSRLYLLTFSIMVLVNLLLFRYLTRSLLKKRHLLMEPVIIVGAGLTAKRLLRVFEEDPGYRYEIRGFLDDHPVCPELTEKYPLLGGLEDTEKVIQRTGVQSVIIATPGLETGRLNSLISAIQPHVRFISYIPDLIGTPMASVTVDNIFSERLLMLNLWNNLARRRNRIMKRLFDLVLTISGGILIMPLLAYLALRIRMDSAGPVFYNADRIGKNGGTFKCYKFRSMYRDGDAMLDKYFVEHPEAKEEWDTYAKLKGYDPRVTKVGVWMRRLSLDELPQVLNVIKGEMSLVGPRPYLPREMADIGEALPTITLTTPGITGYWQTSGRADTTFRERVDMDVWYVKNWSVWIDLMYLAKTFKVVLAGKGAY